jgi:hypothetical protein
MNSSTAFGGLALAGTLARDVRYSSLRGSPQQIGSVFPALVARRFSRLSSLHAKRLRF